MSLGLKSIIMCIIVGVICGCASYSQFAPSQVAKVYPSRTSAEKIELFRTQSPSKKFEEIGTVNACCGSDTNDLIDQLRKKASEHGGDALIGLDIQATGGATASVIRYIE